MANLGESDVEGILTAWSSNTPAITESLNQCFDFTVRLGVGDSIPWAPDEVPTAFDAPGLAVVFTLGTQSVVCLIPESLALPEWYTHPNESQQSRLQTLAMEWSMNMLPAEIEAASFRSVSSVNLKRGLIAGRLPEWAAILLVPVFSKSSGGDAPPLGTLLFAFPLESPTFQESEKPTPKPAPTPPISAPANVPQVEPTAAAPLDRRRRLLLPMPVVVSVRLADKKIEMGTLLGIAPGTLITFNKSCEDLLDMYVNNQRYCRGEAVKIGERFGLKINEVGTEEARESHVLY